MQYRKVESIPSRIYRKKTTTETEDMVAQFVIDTGTKSAEVIAAGKPDALRAKVLKAIKDMSLEADLRVMVRTVDESGKKVRKVYIQKRY